MKCKKCGNEIEKDDKFCGKCGTKNKKNSSTAIIVLLTCICIVISILLVGIIYIYTNEKSHNLDVSTTSFSKSSENKKRAMLRKTASKESAADETNIKFYNEYTQSKITNSNSVKQLIKSESKDQECKYVSDNVVELEDELEQKCGILAVNLGEMSESLALDITDTVEKMYSEYPELKNFITNLSLNNDETNIGAIAVTYAFLPFSYRDGMNTIPSGQKIAVGLNSKYYLNVDYFEQAIEASVNAGYFPDNCTTASSVAHELGHVLMNIARVKKYNLDADSVIYIDDYNKVYEYVSDWKNRSLAQEIINKAYNNCKNEFDTQNSFIESISGYACSKDSYGKTNYEETIAESVHDVYLNGDNAKLASKEIVKVLKKYI